MEANTSSESRRACWVGFNHVSGIGPQRLRRLLEVCGGDVEGAWRASPAVLRQAGIEPRFAEAFVEQRRALDPAGELARATAAGIDVLTWDDFGFPRRLREIDSPPIVLYVRGALDARDDVSLALVGTRQATPYGREMAERLAGELARREATIVSGLARGIDSAAHRAALAVGGRTLAVLAGGLDDIYPPENRRLAEQIRQAGALVSEYPLGVAPQARNFPWRNRIISGLSLGVVVVEAPERSGALITADFANEQGRDVFAVPGSVLSAQSRGPHRLIQQGAKLVTSVEDIVRELNLGLTDFQLEMAELVAPPPAPDADGATEALLLAELGAEPIHIDELRRTCGLPSHVISSTLTLLEIKGLVRRVGGMSFVRTR